MALRSWRFESSSGHHSFQTISADFAITIGIPGARLTRVWTRLREARSIMSMLLTRQLLDWKSNRPEIVLLIGGTKGERCYSAIWLIRRSAPRRLEFRCRL